MFSLLFLLSGEFDDDDLKQLLILIDPTTFDEKYKKGRLSKVAPGLWSFPLISASVALHLCLLVGPLVDRKTQVCRQN